MDATLLTALGENWLDPKEANVYLTTLSLGEASASTIARKIWQKRITTYDILKKLSSKGIVIKTVKGWVFRFRAVSPEILFQQQKEQMHSHLQHLEEILPLLERLAPAGTGKPAIHIYEWLEGLKTMYEESLNSDYQDVIIGKQDMHPEFAAYLYDHFIPRRIKKWMQVRVIYSNQYEADIVEKNNPQDDFREIFVLDHELFNIGNALFLHSEDKFSLAMFHEHEMIWVTIKSRTIHDSLRSIFTMLRLAYQPK